jgi:hypothetical protein
MRSLWHKLNRRIQKSCLLFITPAHKAQLTLFFMIVISIILAITMVAINIGKIARDKTHVDNSADAGALAGASVAAYAFNYVAEANKSDQQRLEGNYNDFTKAMDQYVEKIRQKQVDINRNIEKNLIPPECCSPSICGVPPQAIALAMMDIGMSKQAPSGSWRYKVYQLIKKEGSDQATGKASDDQKGTELGVIPNYWKLQEDFFIAMRERVNDDNKTNDLYQNALSACYRYNLYNSGFPVKMGEDSKQFYDWVNSLTPENVSNGSAETYTWTDGAGRSHMVTATCSIEDFKTWSVNYTKKNRQQIEMDLKQADKKAQKAFNKVMSGAKNDAVACACLPFKPCTSISGCSCYPPEAQADEDFKEAVKKMQEAMDKVDDAREGLNKGGAQQVTRKNGTSRDIIVDLQDITSNAGRSVSSTNFQFHMGGVVKGRRADVDVPTMYPPVQSSATASFRGSGSIPGKEPAHDASLISAH